MAELLAYTERRTLAELADLPHGVYEAEGSVDNDGYTDEPVHLKAKVTVSPGNVHFDFTGSDPQRRAPINSTYAMTFSAGRVRRQVPDRPGPAGERRLLPPDHGRRAEGQRDQLHAGRARSSAAGRRRTASSR